MARQGQTSSWSTRQASGLRSADEVGDRQIVNGHLNDAVDDLRPWTYSKPEPPKAVA